MPSQRTNPESAEEDEAAIGFADFPAGLGPAARISTSPAGNNSIHQRPFIMFFPLATAGKWRAHDAVLVGFR
jgi:hypothetical protein